MFRAIEISPADITSERAGIIKAAFEKRAADLDQRADPALAAAALSDVIAKGELFAIFAAMCSAAGHTGVGLAFDAMMAAANDLAKEMAKHID